MTVPLTMTVNGEEVTVDVEPDALLVDVLRDALGLTGTKIGCREGECGACTVLLDGEPVASCLVPAMKAKGKTVLTVEGLSPDGELHPLQQAFIDSAAVQCGFCTPGMLMSAKALLDRNPDPTKEEIKYDLSGNLCRCTGYAKIIEAVESAAKTLRGERGEGQVGQPENTGAVGASVVKIDAHSKVTGRAIYAADMTMRGMLYGKILRSDRPHARILCLDTSAAEAVPGVVAVVTAEHVPGSNNYGVVHADKPVFADGVVRFRGEALAAVAAVNESVAQTAIEMIRVEYEDLPAVFELADALKRGAPEIHAGGNKRLAARIRKGDVVGSFSQADAIIERTYRTQRQAHAFLEPEAGVAAVDEMGRLTVWFPTQCTHMARAALAKLMALPLRRVRVVQTVCGGAFGGKALFSIEPFLAILSYRTGRPVKIVQTRCESMAYSYKRVPFVIKHRIGARKDGRLVATEVEILADAGAYLGYETPLIVQRAAVHACGPYEIPNVSVDAYYVYTNNVMSGPVRGFGVPQVAFALELQLDLLACKLGLDPLQIRLINAMTQGSVTATGQKLEASVGFKETLLRAGRLAGWELPSTI